MGKNPFLQSGIVGFEWGEVNEERLAVYGQLRPVNEDEFWESTVRFRDRTMPNTKQKRPDSPGAPW